MNKKRIITTALFSIIIIFVFSVNTYNTSAAESVKRIHNGVFIDTVNISGMTQAEAEEAVSDFLTELQKKEIAIQVGSKVVYSTMGELGYTYEPNNYIKQALRLATSGNVIKKYKDIKDIEHGNIIYPLTFSFDENRLRELIAGEVSYYNIEPVNATFSRKNNEFVYVDHVIGSKVDVDQTFELIRQNINSWNRLDMFVEAVMVDDMPAYTREDLENSNSILGEFTTEYTSSAEGRAANLANGARLMNNTVLYPGETFSTIDALMPFTYENGYFDAGAYINGRIVDDNIGGGACQVSTTLYNALLLSEIDIVSRQAHSMTVSYVPLSMDAAVSETGGKDLLFKNNTDLPILIEAFSKDRKITFRIWGHETRDTKNRTVKYENKVVSETAPPSKDIITKDPTQPTTYKKVTQKAKTGYRTELYKVVYENGKEVSRTKINSSYYAAEPNHVTVGTKEVKKDNKDNKDKND
ncbi:VanW family protein [Mobilitalea sibirica]|uniref:VanW family protein n=1 Tax=Mobilitalea sibirica TaxID=1462919 RepID=A0A8J7H8G4_9FIRM|nr:VanW family protein [Mobilitalea sibirica]MBH1940235.1 VanW family protein [Mobilitalea sibirica]